MEHRVLFKRDYNVDDNNDYLLVKEFLICGDDEHKELVLKLINTTNENCKDVKFIVHQLDKDGKEITLSTFESRYMKNNAGKEFVPNKAMTLKKECEDVVIELQFAAFQTAYYRKGELVPFEEKSRSHIVPGGENRFVKQRLFNKPILIAFLVVLSLIALVSFVNNSVADFRVNTKRFLYNGIYYDILNSNQAVEVSGYDSKHDISNLVIPAKVGEYTVTGVKAGAFSYNPMIKNLTIEGNVSINNSAFEECNNLTTLNIKNAIMVGEKAFASCDLLQSVTLNNLEYIGRYAFRECRSLTSAVIENNNKEVTFNPLVFSGCTNLDTIVINQPTSNSSNLDSILRSCNNVRNLTLNELDNSTISNLFGGTTTLNDLSLESISIGQLETVSSKLFANFSDLKKVTIGTVKNGKIEREAFAYSPNLEEVIIEKPITVIGEKAFYETGIKNFNFNGVQVIASYAFFNSKLEKANLTNANISTIEKYAFSNCHELTEVILNNSLKEIKPYCFYNCDKLSRVEMSSGLNYLGEHTFDRCSSLSSINLPKTLKSIGSYSFYNCSSLAAIEIPGTVNSISTSSFQNCISLDTVVINSGITTINSNAFSGCHNIKTLEIPTTVTKMTSGCFSGCYAIEYLTIPFVGTDSTKDTYKSSTFSTLFGSNLEYLKEVSLTKVDTLVSGLFSYNVNLEKASIEGTLNKIPYNLFNGCVNLSEVVLPNLIQTIEYSAFANCHKLHKIVLPETLNTIGDDAFINCYSLWEIMNYSDITVSAGVKNINAGNIGEYTIAVYESLDDTMMLFETIEDKFLFGYYEDKTYLLDYTGEDTEIVLPNNFNLEGVDNQINSYEIYSLVFKEKEIESVNIPEGVYKIGIQAFRNCDQLELVYLPATLTEVDENAFVECDHIYEVYNLTNYPLVIGSSEIGEVAENALIIHTSLSELPLIKYTSSENVEYRLNPNSNNGWILGFKDSWSETILIGSSFYNDNRNYSSFVILPGAFYGYDIKSVTIGSGVEEIGEYSFQNCLELESVTVQGTNLKSIKDYAFAGCNNLTEFTISSSSRLSSIGVSAFYDTNLFEMTIPVYVKSIGDNAFYSCENLTFVINRSNLSFTEGSSSYGYVGYYAFDVVGSQGEILTHTYNNFVFAKKSGSWYIIKYNKEIFDNSLISFPDSFTYNGQTVSKYYVWKNLSSYSYGYYDIYLPTSVIQFMNGINISIDVVYFKGTSNQWYSTNHYYNNTFAYTTVKYYSTCVHDNSTWTYVNSEISTSRTELTDNIVTQVTCTTDGLNRKYCPKCANSYNPYYEEHIIYATGHQYGADNKCTNCTARKVPVTESVLNSAIFSNDQNNPFIWSNNYIKTPSLDRYETSTLTLNANRKMTVAIQFTGYLTYYDNIEIVVNGVSVDILYYNDLYYLTTYNYELYAGQSLEIIFNKQSNDTSVYANISMTIYYE